MLDDLSPDGPTVIWALSSRPDQGAQPYMVGGPPSPYAIKTGGGRRLATRGSPEPSTPPTPKPID
jgi:hypothetical protein